MRRRGIFLFDQVLRRREEIVEDVLLVGECPGHMPLFAIFSPTTEICIYEHTSLVQPNADEWAGKKRFLADAVSTVTVQDRRIGAVELDPFAAKDIQRHTCAIFGEGEVANDFRVVELSSRGLIQSGAGGFSSGRIKAIPSSRLEVRGHRK